MANTGTFTPLHPTTRKYVARTVQEPLPERLRELIDKLHEAEPIRNPRERGQTQRRAPGKKCGPHA
jgi:hypothetical protein